jgi:dCTP deaminase
MAVLSNLAILAALDSGRMRISPRPAPGPEDKDTPYNTSSVDLRLASELLIPRPDLSLTFDLRRGGDGVAETIDRVCDRTVIPDSGFVLEPNRFILGRTIEEVAFPLDGRLAARVEGRSSLARTGLLVHFTAPTIHAGFEGTITLEIMNLGPLALVLTPELRICQLIVETIEGEPRPTPSQFHGQGTPSGR